MADGEQIYLTKDVFVAGSSPSITYNPRDDRHLEREMAGYLNQGPGRALTVSGPTKSGKTVLVERSLPRDEAIWMEGPDLRLVDDFWDRIIDWLGLYDVVEVSRTQTEGSERERGFEIGIPKVLSGHASKTNEEATAFAVQKSRSRAVTSVARESLQTVQIPLVIDDFHYIADDAKVDVARAIKTVIPHSKAILIAVPHEAFDVVRNEPDMGFRVSQLEIQTWSIEELLFIAIQGFAALNIKDEAGIGERLAAESYGAPFLMQELCYQYVTVELGQLQTAIAPISATEPQDWDGFLASIANRNPPAIFETLLKGPKTRGQQRIPRIFKAGSKTDVYGALLYGIAKVGKAQVSYQQLARVLDRDLLEPISGQQITASLGHMAALADVERGSGDASVAYKNDDLHVLDPFLLFYLTHGEWSVSKQMTETED